MIIFLVDVLIEETWNQILYRKCLNKYQQINFEMIVRISNERYMDIKTYGLDIFLDMNRSQHCCASKLTKHLVTPFKSQKNFGVVLPLSRFESTSF